MLVIVLPVYMVFLNFTALLPILLLLGDRKVSIQSIGLVIGGLCFYISDNTLGRSKFVGLDLLGARWIRDLLIMGTYYLAQYFIPIAAMQSQSSLNEEETTLMESQIE